MLGPLVPSRPWRRAPAFTPTHTPAAAVRLPWRPGPGVFPQTAADCDLVQTVSRRPVLARIRSTRRDPWGGSRLPSPRTSMSCVFRRWRSSAAALCASRTRAACHEGHTACPGRALRPLFGGLSTSLPQGAAVLGPCCWLTLQDGKGGLLTQRKTPSSWESAAHRAQAGRNSLRITHVRKERSEGLDSSPKLNRKKAGSPAGRMSPNRTSA